MRALLLPAVLLLSVACRGQDTDKPGPETTDADGDGWAAEQDCDDDDPDVNPGADEVPYDGLDNDCNEDSPDDDLDRDGYALDDDCDDDDPTVNPGATEVCNGYDDDCDGEVDDAAGDIWYADEDADLYGDPTTSTSSCSGAITGWVADRTDCDDTDPDVNPAAHEVCNDVDDDCDGHVDRDADDATDWWVDADGDGYGNPDFSQEACDAPEGYVDNHDDCDDGHPEAYPEHPEVCDGVDNDCNGLVDDDPLDVLTWYRDSDGDGYGSDLATEACEAPADHVDNADDCDDSDPLAFPGAREVCNLKDDDCDGTVDDDPLDGTAFYVDGDGDGYGDPDLTLTACTAPTGYVTDDADCDDTDDGIHPFAPEHCDTVDEDCDGTADEDPVDAPRWYGDSDGDGYGDPGLSVQACAAPAGFVADDSDCDDARATSHPGAPEVCDGLDNDCDATADEDATDATTFYADGDADGFGDPAATRDACAAPAGYVANADDCDDLHASVSPLGTERCNDLDDDCDGSVDDGALDAPTWYADADADTYGDASAPTVACEAPAGSVADATDCDDTDPDTHPTADETCNGLDDDCDGTVDEDATDGHTVYYDGDGDSFGLGAVHQWVCTTAPGWADADGDCDDTSAVSFPGGTEVCDRRDNDCDGTTDLGATDAPTWYADADRDGFGDATVSATACAQPVGFVADDTDCDDSSRTTSPAGLERCGGGDEDCDGLTDEADALDATDWYTDGDGDGYGNPAAPTSACTAPADTVSNPDDCDDSAAATYPGAPEDCAAADRDCDGDPTDGATDASTWYLDRDGDGYGTTAYTVLECTQPAGFSSVSGDCNDALPLVHTAGTEVCDGLDNDCDGLTDEADAVDAGTWYADTDADGYGDPATATLACTAPTGFVSDSSDCADWDELAYPGSHELEVPYDGTDQDCDGDDFCHDLDCNGYPDWVGSTHYDGNYATQSYVLYNDGTGLSTDRADMLETYGPFYVTVHDVDGNGYQDLLFAGRCAGGGGTTCVDAGDSFIYYGTPFGYSTAERDTLYGRGAYVMKAADLDHDGTTDVVVANYEDGGTYAMDSYVYWGSASGFTTRTDLPTRGAAYVTIADVDQDGWEDLVFANSYSGSSHDTTSSIYWGSATGYDPTHVTDLETHGAHDALVRDLNHDGYMDVVFANHRTDSSYVTDSFVYWGSSAGWSELDRTGLEGNHNWRVYADDLDGDGWEDLVLAGYYDGDYTANTYVYWGSATGYDPTDRSTLPVHGGERHAIADLDHDGYKDIVIPNYYDGSSYLEYAYIYWGSVSGYSDADRTTLTGMSGAITASIADLDGDGWEDLVFDDYYGSGGYSGNAAVFWNHTGYFSDRSRDLLPTWGVWHSTLVGAGVTYSH